MRDFVTPERRCDNCGGRFSWDGQRWVMADENGRITYSSSRSQTPGPAPVVQRCPLCHFPLKRTATVREEKS